jgi:GNAT superfamily N-acetyltransferase
VEIRRATTEEAKRLKEFDPFLGERRIDNWRGELFVAVHAETLLGYITFSSALFYNRPFISLLFVREPSRHRGVGTALIRRVLELYEGLEVWISTEAVNDPAIRMFTRLGFRRSGQIEGLDGEGSMELFFRYAVPTARSPSRA